MYVCLCNGVTDADIHDAVDTGITSFEDLQTHLSVGTVCGSCECEAKQVVEKKLNSSLAARASGLLVESGTSPSNC